ncbi:hypothetical protein AC1031_007895 [Aphanomyces cochlioides]|nr:hypothetical protein AC1031_007895 [Aphanomyces cochlioides]
MAFLKTLIFDCGMMKVTLELSHVVFPTRNDPFRVQVGLTEDNLPMRIWIESKHSKSQWECVVKDIREHVPKGASYSLPTNVILTSVQDGLSRLDREKKKDMNVEGCSVELKESKPGHLDLILTLKAFRSLEAQYTFKMTPMTIEKVDILEAKIRVLQKALDMKNPTILWAISTKAVAPKSCVVWDDLLHSNKDYIQVQGDKLILLRSGMYEIQLSGRVQNWNEMDETVRCQVDGECVASAIVGRSRVFGINHLLPLDEKSEVRFLSCGEYNLAPECILYLVLVKEPPTK